MTTKRLTNEELERVINDLFNDPRLVGFYGSFMFEDGSGTVIGLGTEREGVEVGITCDCEGGEREDRVH